MALGMNYQRSAAATVDADDWPGPPAVDAVGLAEANINPTTGLATDYLNTFNEAIMLLEMLSSAPEFRDDFLNWRPVSYREHFEKSHLRTRDTAIAAYDCANPYSRACLNDLTGSMTTMLETTRAVLDTEPPPDKASAFADEAAAALRLLVARAGAVINGTPYFDDVRAPQAAIDDLMKA